jgi:hypothetical protein
VIGAAAFHGSDKILKYVLGNPHKPAVNYPAQEK